MFTGVFNSSVMYRHSLACFVFKRHNSCSDSISVWAIGLTGLDWQTPLLPKCTDLNYIPSSFYRAITRTVSQL